MAVSDDSGDGDDQRGSGGRTRVTRSRRSRHGHDRSGADAERTAEADRTRGRIGRLQGSLGNQAVQRLAEDGTVQRAATGGGSGDRFEREAEQVARAAVRPGDGRETGRATRPSEAALCTRCQRRRAAGEPLDCPDCLAALREQERARSGAEDPSSTGDGPALQRAAVESGGRATSSASTPDRAGAGPESGSTRTGGHTGSGGGPSEQSTVGEAAGASRGRSLPDSVRTDLERRLGYDFGDVRVHTGPHADAMARSLDAVAFTVGRDVFFRAGAYRPGTVEGKRLLAHELTHVVQQGASEPLADRSATAAGAPNRNAETGPTPVIARTSEASVQRQGLGFGLSPSPGTLLGSLWLGLDRGMKLRLVNLAIDGALATIEKFPGRAMLGGLWLFVKSGLLGFYRRLRSAEAEAKLTAVDKLARIMSGQSLEYATGLLVGTLKGFFVEGLWGIVETIEMVVGGLWKLWDFLDAVEKLVGAFPETVATLVSTARQLGATLATNIGPAMQEIANLLTDPQAVAALVGPIVEAGQAKATQIGTMVADKLLEFFTKPGAEATVGEATGKVIGIVLFEALFAYLTAGAGTAVTALKAVGKQIATLGGRFAGSVLRVFKALLPYFDTVIDAVKAVGRVVKGRVLGAVSKQVEKLLETLKELSQRFVRHCHESTLECDFRDTAATKADDAGDAGRVTRKADDADEARATGDQDTDVETKPRTETVPLSELSPQRIRGIGEKRARMLRDAGVENVEQLKRLTKKELDDILDASAPVDDIKRRVDEFEPPTRRVGEMTPAEKYLKWVKQIHSHHLVPKGLLKKEGFAERLRELGLGKTSRTADPDPERFLDEQIAEIPTKEHQKLHNMRIEGKTYNEWWLEWYEKNPNFTKKDLLEQKKKLIGTDMFDIPKSYLGGRLYGRSKTPRAAKKRREKLGSDD